MHPANRETHPQDTWESRVVPRPGYRPPLGNLAQRYRTGLQPAQWTTPPQPTEAYHNTAPQTKLVYIRRDVEPFDEYAVMAKVASELPARSGSRLKIENGSNMHVTLLYSVKELLSKVMLEYDDEDIADRLLDTVPGMKEHRTVEVTGVSAKYGYQSSPTIGLDCAPGIFESERMTILQAHGGTPENRFQAAAMYNRDFHVSLIRDTDVFRTTELVEAIEPYRPHDLHVLPAVIFINGRRIVSG